MIAITQEDCNERVRDYARRKIQDAGAKVTVSEDESWFLVEFPNGKKCKYFPISGWFEDMKRKACGQGIAGMLRRGGLGSAKQS